VTQITDPMARTSSFTYNNVGQLMSPSFPAPNAETVSYSYDGNGRMRSVTDNRDTTSLAYENASDRVSSVTDPVTGAVSYT
jgi:YD repeat-containing protein